jgi:seryl-tRNA synthetase
MKYTINLGKNRLNEDEKKLLYEKISYFNESIYSVYILNTKIQIFSNIKRKSFFTFFKKEIFNLLNFLKNEKKLLKKEIIYESKKKDILNKFNAYKHLIDTKNLIKLFDGVYSFQSNLLKLSDEFNKVLLNFSKKNDYREAKYSGILKTNALINNSYIHSFPNHCLLVSSVKRNNNAIRNVSNIKVNEFKKFKKHLSNPELILSPTVCYNCFETIKKTNLKKNTKFTAISNCHRYEGLINYQLERLKVYEMREFMFFGDQEFIKKQIKIFTDFFIKFLNNNKLIFRIVTANDPFFLKTMNNKRIFQLANKLKYELEMYLPFEKKWIAVGSFNNHLNTLTKKYEITKNKKTCYSGCIGIGYERFLYSYFSQKKKFKFD